MSQLQLLVCDWDGTLVDSVSQIVACKRELASKYHLPTPTEETVRGVLGTEFAGALKICFPTATVETLEYLACDYHELMGEARYQAMLFPGAYDVLLELKKQGVYLAVATAKARVEFDKAIHWLKLSGMFDITCCGEEFKSKPNPDMLKSIMYQVGVGSGVSIMIGDTTTDMLFANNAHVRAIAVTFGAHRPEQLLAMNPAALINDWSQLPEVWRSLC